MRIRLGGWICLLIIALLACGPIGPVPGHRIHGEQSSSPPGDWSFTHAHETIQLEVRPADPYSVNVWCVATGGNLYVGAGRGESSVWARALLDDGKARVRIGTLLYDVVAARVTAVAEIEACLDALAKKYEASDAHASDFEPNINEPAPAVLFRLSSSPREGAA